MARLKLFHKNASFWTSLNPVLLDGEIAVEKDTKQIKIGDGVTSYNNLEYAVLSDSERSKILNLPSDTVSELASKASTGDPRFSDERTPIDNSVSTVKLQDYSVTHQKLSEAVQSALDQNSGEIIDITDGDTITAVSEDRDTLIYTEESDIEVFQGTSPNRRINRLYNLSGTGDIVFQNPFINTTRNTLPAATNGTYVDLYSPSSGQWFALPPGLDYLTTTEEPQPSGSTSGQTVLQSISVSTGSTQTVTLTYSNPVTVTSLNGFFIRGPYHFTSIISGTSTSTVILELNDHIVPETDFKILYARQYGDMVDQDGKKVASIPEIRPEGLEDISTYNGSGTLRKVASTGETYTSISSAIDDAVAGDWVLIKRGEQFDNSGIIKSKSGTTNNYITICAFGDTNSGLPVLNFTSGTAHAIRFNNSHYIHISDLVVNAASGNRAFTQHGNNIKNYTTNCRFLANGGPATLVSIEPDTTPGTPSTDTNFLFNELVGPSTKQLMKVTWGAIVNEGYYISFNKFSDAENEDLLRFIHENNTTSDPDPTRTFNFLVASFNEVTDWDQDGIDCFGANDLILEYNIAHDPKPGRIGNGIKCGGRDGTGGGSDTPPGHNIIARYNWAYDCNGYGLATNRNSDGQFYGNLVERCDQGIRIDNGSAGDFRVDNNTVVDCRVGLSLENTTGTVIARNNIVHATSQAVFANAPTKIGQNNIFLGGSIDSDFSNSNGLTSTKSATFIDATSGNYRLRENSNAINNGVSISGYTQDREGNIISGGTDIGCYEYVTTSTASTGGTSTQRTAWFLGDSIMYVTTANQQGYAERIANYFHPNLVVENRGNPGESATSFLELQDGSGRDWKSITGATGIQEGDYVFIGFGHNNKAGTSGIAETDTEFESSLLTMINGVKAKNAIPVLVSPMARMRYTGFPDFTGTAGQLLAKGTNNQHSARPTIVSTLATDESVLFLDLFNTSWDLFNAISATECNDTYGDGQRNDTTHLGDFAGTQGADRIAKEFVTLTNGTSDEVLKAYMLSTSGASYVTDDNFESYSIASGLPANWSNQWDTGASYAIVGNGDNTKSLQISGSDGQRLCTTFDDSSGFLNGDVLIKLRWSAPPSGGLVLRASGNETSETGYIIRLIGDPDNIQITRYLNNAFNIIQTEPFTFLDNMFYYIRTNISGSTINAKIWNAENSEPSSWTISATNTDIQGSGKVGFMRFNNSITVDYLGYTTDPTKTVPVP